MRVLVTSRKCPSSPHPWIEPTAPVRDLMALIESAQLVVVDADDAFTPELCRRLATPCLALGEGEDLDAAVAEHFEQRTPRRLKVALTHNVRRVDPKSGDDVDAEFDAPSTIAAIADAIRAHGHQVVLLEANRDLPRRLGDLDVDLAFNIAEGIRGQAREAQVPAVLELVGVPYTGSDPAALAITLDKGLAKRLVREAGVATPRARTVLPGDPVPTDLRFPVIVKPNAEGSSKGVTAASVASDAVGLGRLLGELHARYGSGMLVEEFLPGREFTVGVLDHPKRRTLPIMEVVFDKSLGDTPVYSYAHKTETEGGVGFEVPAKLDESLAEKIRKVALESFAALGCRDVGRVDVRLDADGEPNFIEVNPLPGLVPEFSDLCVAAKAEGMDHKTLVGAILAPALARAGR